MMEGLEGLEYTNRGTISQTVQGAIQTIPDSNRAQNLGTAPAPSGAPSAEPPAVQQQPVPAPEPRAEESNLVGELAKRFGKEIGEPGKEHEQLPASPGAEKPPVEKTWREAEPPPTATKKVQETWNDFKQKARAEVEAKEKAIRELQAELDQVKGRVTNSDALQQQLQQAQSIVERIAIERSPLFKLKVLDQEELLRARLGKTVEGTGLTPAEADAVLRGDLNTRERVLDSRQMSPFRRQQIVDILSHWDRVSEERERLTARGKETLTEFLREQQVAQEAQRAQYIRDSEKIFDDQLTLASQKIEVYHPIDGNDAWNKTVNDLKTTARKLYSGQVPRELLAQAAILAPAAVALQNLLRSSYTEINSLKAQLARYQGVQPQVRDSGGDVTQPAKALSSPNGDFVKSLVDRFRADTGLQ